jgi:hypothetical protein
MQAPGNAPGQGKINNGSNGTAGARREALAQDPLSTDDILTGFYRPSSGRPVTPAQAAPQAPVAEHGPLISQSPSTTPTAPGAPARPGQGNGVAAHPLDGAPFGVSAAAPVSSLAEEGEYCEEPMDLRGPGQGQGMTGGKKPKPSHYKIVCISLYTEDIARLDGLVAELKRRGHTKANKSQVIRAALEQIDLDKVPKAH